MSGYRLGVDLGGTKIEIVAIDPSGAIQFRKRTSTPQGDYEGTLNAIKSLVEDAEKAISVSNLSVGVGMPGAISPHTKLIKNSNSLCLIGKPLDKDLEKVLNRPVKLANDANCFALSEAIDGAGKNAKTVFGVILGTGCGGGLVVDKKALEGHNAICGEWGHNALAWPTELEWKHGTCYCGKKLCNELYISGTGISNDHLLVTRNKLRARDIDDLASKGDLACEETMQRFEDRLARALSQIINVFDPDIIILGGGVSNLKRIYKEVPRLLEKYVFSDEVRTPIVPAQYGDSSGVRGAAWLW